MSTITFILNTTILLGLCQFVDFKRKADKIFMQAILVITSIIAYLSANHIL